MSSKDKATPNKDWRISGPWAGAWKVFAGIGVLGLVGAGAGYATDPRRFAFSWLFAFITVLTVALGSLFFVILQHLVSAGWSVTVRRTAEFFAVGLWVMLLLFVPVLGTMSTLFPWLGHHGNEPGGADAAHVVGAADAKPGLSLITPAFAQEHAPDPGATHGNPPPANPGDPAGALPGAHGGVPGDSAGHGSPEGAHLKGTGAESAAHGGHPGHAAAHGPAGDPHELIEKELLEKKSGYLNRTFFLIRVAIYFFAWLFMASRLFGFSTKQDTTKDPKLTLAAQRFAPPAVIVFALTLTFAAFDWIMSLEPTWFSTIFGVVIFACGVVSSYAVIILTTLALRSSGPLDGAVTIEHYHDLGKLMFGFLVFWAYVSFSQYMLIWYAALPEETTFFHNRWDYAPWENVSLAVILFHFVAPFFWTISRNFKRNVGRLRIGALIILVMHVVDMYWFVMPNFMLGKTGFSFHWLDVVCLMAVAGIYCAFVFYRMTQFSLIPIGDPRLQRSLHFQNA